MDGIEEEFAGARLGDPRRSSRLVKVGVALARDPGLSFPRAMGSEGELEALYRFLNNESLTAQKVQEPHRLRTLSRCAEEGTFLVLHDTSSFAYSGAREGLGRIHTRENGFFLHASLAVTRGRAALGVLRAETWARTSPPRPRGENGKRLSPRAVRQDPERESLRWGRAVEQCEIDLGMSGCAIHVMDREGDNFDLFSELESKGYRYVIRAAHDRNVLSAEKKLFATAANAPCRLSRTVPLSARTASALKSKAKIHPGRKTREALLEVRALTVELVRPDPYASGSPESLSVNVVVLREQNCPDGYEPVQWHLVTNEPIRTPSDLEKIVDAYRARWTIEEFFKSLKTGCQFEKRQLESFQAMRIALSLFLPIAVALLSLRDAARDQPEQPCDALTTQQLDVLAAVTKKSLGPKPNNADAYQALARLGGHLKSNGPPGWMVLGRAYEKLLILEVGWMAAKSQPTSDR